MSEDAPRGAVGGPGTPGIPQLSVVITAWNAADSISRTIESVLDEHDVPLECIVVDDASTDDTASVVGAIAARDPRVVPARLPANAGVSAARNRGLELARGEWLAFADADDRLLPGAIDALMRPTRTPGIRAVIGQRVWFDGERTWIGVEYDNPDIRAPGRKSIATHPGLLYYMSTHGRVLHRSLVDGLSFYGRVLGDQPWTIRALLRAGDAIEVIDDVVYEWTRPHPDRYVPTITSERGRSADRATDMVAVAGRAFRDVSDEVDAVVAGDAVRLALKRAYLDRLLKPDFSSAIRPFVGRADPELDRVLDALGTFLESVPPAVLSESNELHTIFDIPLKRWLALQPNVRAAYVRLLQRALRAGGDPIGGPATGLALRAAARLVTAAHVPRATSLAAALLTAAATLRRLRRGPNPA